MVMLMVVLVMFHTLLTMPLITNTLRKYQSKDQNDQEQGWRNGEVFPTSRLWSPHFVVDAKNDL